MQITVDKVRVGDYVNNFGIVSKIKYFYRSVAVRGRTARSEKRGLTRLDYARLVEEQQEWLYNQVLDSVVLYVGNLSKTYSADVELSVLRISKAA